MRFAARILTNFWIAKGSLKFFSYQMKRGRLSAEGKFRSRHPKQVGNRAPTMHGVPGLHSAAPKELAGCAQGCMPLIQGLVLHPPVGFLQCYKPTLAWKTSVMAWAEFLAAQIMLLSQEQKNRMEKKAERSYEKKSGFEHVCAPCFLRQKETYLASSEDVQA